MSENKKRLQFYWNHNKFPDPKAWANKCQEDYKLEFCANVKPVILCEHPWYEELSKKGLFIKSGSSDLVAEFWGGKGSWIDFKNPKAQEWWKKQYKEHLLSNNIRGIWNDNNEFEIFSEHEHSGNEMELTLLMNILAWEASLEYAPNRRPWVLTRSGFAGVQRYAQTWTGDNNSSWKSLQYDNAIVSGMAISGLIHSGTDIGGFWGESPSSELLTRWIQNGVFMPRFCIHSYKPNVTEPWLYKDSNPDHYEIIKSYMQLRKELFPYLYNASYQAHSIGRPIQRLVAYDFQNDSNTWEQSFEYMFGDALLIAPIYEPQASSRELYLPRIEEPQVNKWIDYWTHKEYVGGQKIRVPVSMENIPVFVKANSIIPLQRNGLELEIFLAKNDEEQERTIDIIYELYEDDRETLNYLKGDYLKSFFTYKFKLTDKDYTLLDKDIKKEGTYSSQYEKVNIKTFYNAS